jgi:uncharacterized membrane protein YdjX (TVP38/TMEM64 family)
MAVFVGIAMLSAMVAFFSSAIFVPVAIYAWGNAVAFVLLWLGWLLGGVASFCIGRFLGRRVAAALIGEAVVPSEIPGYLLGILHYRFSLYLLALAVTELPYVVGVVYLGEHFLKGQSMVILLFGIAVVLLAIALMRQPGKSAGQG